MLVKKIIKHPTPGVIRQIPLSRGKFAIVDESDYKYLSQFYWQAKKSKACWYAVRKFRRNHKTIYIKMHREITNAAPGTDVHHENLNSLDNRRSNLTIMSPKLHKLVHKTRGHP